MIEWLASIASKLPFSEAARRGLDRVPWLDLQRSHATRAHDAAKFAELNAVLSERALQRFLTDAFNLSIPEVSYQPVWQVLDEFQSIESEMLNRVKCSFFCSFSPGLLKLRRSA
jgi:hypothetical protein